MKQLGKRVKLLPMLLLVLLVDMLLIDMLLVLSQLLKQHNLQNLLDQQLALLLMLLTKLQIPP